MHHHLTSDTRDWINEILTLSIHSLVTPLPREQAVMNQWGKKIMSDFTLV